MTNAIPSSDASIGRPLRLFLVAAEESADRLGGALMRALRDHATTPPQFLGLGGADMAAEGLASLFPIDDLAIIGFSAIPRRLPDILRRIRQTADAVIAAEPDVLVIIDGPEFTHRVAKRVRKAAPSIPIVDYVSPSVWAWRPWRARAMRAYVDHVLALLPFEPAAHERLGGPPCTYVGHPLSGAVSRLRPDPDDARRRLAEPPILLVLPGSRSGEISKHSNIFGQALKILKEQDRDFDVVVPTVQRLAARVAEASAAWPVQPRIVADPAGREAAMRGARAALTKSGTVTLELALAGVPMVAAYRVSFPEYLVGKALIHGQSAILANLVLGRNVVPEFLQYDCTPERLAEALAPILSDTPQRRAQVDAFAELDQIMEIGTADPARRAADIVMDIAARRPDLPPSSENRLS